MANRPFGFAQFQDEPLPEASPLFGGDLMTARLMGGLPLQTSEDRLNDLIGMEPVPEAVAPEQFNPGGGWQGFLETIGPSLMQIQAPRAKNFGQGLVTGLARGLGTAGSRVALARQKFDQQQALRQKETDEDRRRVMTERRAAIRGLAGEDRAQGRAKDLAQFRFDLEAPERKAVADRQAATDTRLNASAARADAAAARSVVAQDRANNLAQVNTVGKLFDDYQNDRAVKGYQAVRSNLNTAETAAQQKSGPGDIALVFSFMRALEPENPNAVREGEYDNARQATGLLNQVRNLPSRYFQGNQLTEPGRQFFLRQMRATLQSRRGDYDLANDQYRRRAESGGVDPSLFIRDYPVGSAQSRANNGRPPLSSFETP